MNTTTLGKPAPDFIAESTQGPLQLSKLQGQNVVLYFYPKDHTPGCTLESCGFRDAYEQFKRLNTVILGISRDTLKSHEKFQTKHSLPFTLIADTDEKICTLYDVIQAKNMFGIKTKGIQRSTFLIDQTGKLQQEWRKVKVFGHVKEVLQAAEAFRR